MYTDHMKQLNDESPAPTLGDPPATAENERRIDALAEVHTRVLDTIAGFEKTVDKAEPEFEKTAQTFLWVHRRHEEELATALRRFGREPQDDGSFFATVNRAAIEVRSWFEEVSTNIMDRVIEGEKHVLESYEAAAAAGLDASTRTMLERHAEEIRTLLDANAIRR